MKRILAIVGAIVLGASPALAQSFPDYINGRQAFSAASPPTFLPTDMIGLVRGNTTYKVPATSFGGGGTTSITIGTTPITSGTTGRVLYDNGALVGELTAAQLTATVAPCTPTLAGTAPTPPNDVTKFLNGQCGWTIPAGGAANPAGANGDFQINSAGVFGAFTPGASIQTFLTTPTSANLRAALTDETGTGAAYFVGGALGTPSSGTATNLTGLPTSGLTGALLAAQFPALTGDVTTAGGALATTITSLAVTTAKINTAAVTYAKVQNGASTGLLGVNNAAAPTEVAVGSGLSLSAGTLSATGGGATTGMGVDGGTSAQTLTGTATVANGTRLVKIGSGWVTGTLTLPAISAVSADTCIRFQDAGTFIDGSHTLTIKGGVSDGLNGGAANGTSIAFTSTGLSIYACVTAANQWNLGPGTLAGSTAPSHQFASSLTANGLSYSQPSIGDISGLVGRTAVADANCAALTSATILEAFTTVLTAARSCTLPAASALLAGQRICFVDEGDGTNPAINGANTVTINRAGSDKINGATSFVMGVGYAAVCLESDASAKWSTVTNQNISAQGATSNNFLTGIGSDGVFTRAQPSVSNISGFGTNVATALGVNLSATGGLPKIVAQNAKALATGAISSAACTSAQTDTATGTLTTDVVLASFNGDPTAVTGYVPLTAGMLTIIAYPTADTVNFKVCNNTSGSITPGAITLNWKVLR